MCANAVLASDRPKTPSVCRECRGVGGRHKLDCETGKRSPREQEPGPGLELAERNLRDGYVVVESQAKAIADELDRLRAELAKAQANYQFMVDRACDERLDGYRELASKLCAAEEDCDRLRALVRELGGEP